MRPFRDGGRSGKLPCCEKLRESPVTEAATPFWEARRAEHILAGLARTTNHPSETVHGAECEPPTPAAAVLDSPLAGAEPRSVTIVAS